MSNRTSPPCNRLDSSNLTVLPLESLSQEEAVQTSGRRCVACVMLGIRSIVVYVPSLLRFLNSDWPVELAPCAWVTNDCIPAELHSIPVMGLYCFANFIYHTQPMFSVQKY